MLVELLAAAVAVVLTIAIVVSELRGPPPSGQTSRRHPPSVAGPGAGGGVAPGPRSSVPPPREAGNLLEDPSFEDGLGRWRAGRGARLDRAAEARSGAWAARLTAATSPAPGMAIGEAGRCQARKQYAVTVWLRASRAGTVVRVDLAEQSGGTRFAVDTAGAVLQGQQWEPLEVHHVTHESGAALAIEVAAVQLPSGGHVLVDDLSLRESAGPARP
jgi:hypothetical protein